MKTLKIPNLEALVFLWMVCFTFLCVPKLESIRHWLLHGTSFIALIFVCHTLTRLGDMLPLRCSYFYPAHFLLMSDDHCHCSCVFLDGRQHQVEMLKFKPYIYVFSFSRLFWPVPPLEHQGFGGFPWKLLGIVSNRRNILSLSKSLYYLYIYMYIWLDKGTYMYFSSINSTSGIVVCAMRGKGVRRWVDEIITQSKQSRAEA